MGVDLSPNMAARTQRTARHKFPHARTHCQAVDARQMPFRNESFDAVFCCYLLELLSADDIVSTLGEFRRILRDRGHLTLVLIGQNTAAFNAIYKVLGKVAPAFWGRQVEQRVPELIEVCVSRFCRIRWCGRRSIPHGCWLRENSGHMEVRRLVATAILACAP